MYLGGAPARFSETTGLIDTPALGASLARDLGNASTVLMRNHGITFVGPEYRDRDHDGRVPGAGVPLAARAARYRALPIAATAPEEIAQKHDEIFDPGLIETFLAFFKRRADQLRAPH